MRTIFAVGYVNSRRTRIVVSLPRKPRNGEAPGVQEEMAASDEKRRSSTQRGGRRVRLGRQLTVH